MSLALSLGAGRRPRAIDAVLTFLRDVSEPTCGSSPLHPVGGWIILPILALLVLGLLRGIIHPLIAG
jgi:hypothetical protein